MKNNVSKAILKQIDVDEIPDSNERLVKGWASVEIKDLDGEIIPIKEMKKAMMDIMLHGRTIVDSHSNRVIGEIINFELRKNPRTNRDGIFLTYKIYNGNGFFDEVWDEIKSGKRRGLSFGGFAEEKSFDSVNSAQRLEKVTGFEMSSVNEPANPEALNVEVNLLAKSKKIQKGERCMQLLVDKGFAREEAHDICYADDIPLQQREAMSKSERVKFKYQRDLSNNSRIGGSVMTKEVEKIDVSSIEKVLERFDALEKRLSNLEKRYEEEEEEDDKKPREEEEKKKQGEMTDGGTQGSTEVNPSPEGGEVKLPKAPAGETDEDDSPEGDKVDLLEKQIEKAVEKKMSELGIQKGKVAPRPAPQDVRKSESKPEEDDAYLIATGVKKFNSADYEEKQTRQYGEMIRKIVEGN